tara:strand:+ start:658 stop:2163 length:1506 start_codon:yes stop_codon:yes gene_type:complete
MINSLVTNIKKSRLIINAYSFLFKNGKKFFTRKDLFQLQFDKKIDHLNKEFKESGDEIKEVEAYVDPNLNSVVGWLPYLNGQTSIFIYHFFSTNYSLRKQTLIRLTIIKEKQLVAQKLFWFPVYSVFDFKLEKYFGDIDGESVIVEMFHPNIRRNHGGNDGHLRSWGKYYLSNGNCSSTTHSLHLNKSDIIHHKFIQTRNYFPDKFDGKGYHYSKGHVETEKNRNLKIYAGFNVFKDKNDNPRAVWHHGHLANPRTPLDNNSKKLMQGFWCPPSKKINPTIILDSFETGVKGNNPLEIFLVKDSVVFKKKKIIFEDLFQSNVSKIFNETIPGPYHIYLNFFANINNNNENIYAHVNYDTKDNCGDSVHTMAHNLTIENDKIKQIEVKKSGNARKFMHFSKFNDDIENYLVIHLDKVKERKNLKLNIRIYTDKTKEYLFSYELNGDEPTFIIELKELFKGSKIDMNEHGVVQIESVDHNFDGLLLCLNSKTDEIMIDHLTGG